MPTPEYVKDSFGVDIPLRSSLQTLWEAQLQQEKIRQAELAAKTRIVREIMSIPGITIVALDGIEPNTVIVSREIYKLCTQFISDRQLNRMGNGS